MSSLFEDLAQDLERDLPRCPRGAIIKALADAWRDLCRRALVWRPVYLIDRSAGQTRYLVQIKESADVVQVDRVRWRNAAEVAADLPGQALNLSAYSFASSDTGFHLVLRHPPQDDQASGLSVQVVLAPTRNSTDIECDEPLFLRYQDGIIGGALFDLASTPRRPWTSPTVAKRGRRDFLNAVSMGLSDRIKNFAPGQSILET
jgi:hypothetical protein